MPKRIQRKRTKGFKLPPSCVYVGRPTIFGNPFRLPSDRPPINGTDMRCYTREDAIEAYKSHLRERPLLVAHIRGALQGKDLACWCPLDQPCHADVLLELANS